MSHSGGAHEPGPDESTRWYLLTQDDKSSLSVENHLAQIMPIKSKIF